MSLKHELKIGEIIKESDIYRIFGGQIRRGIRRNQKDNLIVVIHDPNGIYQNRWDNNVLYYTGEGQTGDQNLKDGNIALRDSKKNGKTVYLLEKISKDVYRYLGIVVFDDDEPLEENQPDKNGDIRKVYVFRLRPTNEVPPISQNDYEVILNSPQNEARKKDLKTLEKILKGRVKRKSSVRQVKVIERDPFVSEYVKRLANGICDLCERSAPFEKNGVPFLETHHIVWLSEGGSDTVDNVAAVCPNCHRKVHHLKLKKDVAKMKMIAEKRSKNMLNNK